MNNKKQGLNITTFKVSKKLQIQQVHQTTFEEMGTGYETIKLEDNTEEDKAFLDVTEGMTDEEIKEYEEHKRQRNKRVKKKLDSSSSEQMERPHAHIDEEWQREIIEDLEMEFNERNRGGYGR